MIPAARADAPEGWRRLLHGTLGPVAALVGAELERVGLSGRLQGGAGAFLQLRDGGRASQRRGRCADSTTPGRRSRGGVSRHAAVGGALMAYAWADEEPFS